MEFKGTKGPWKQDPVNKHQITCEGWRIANVIMNLNQQDTSEANAQLIAAAPELLEALKGLYDSTAAVMELLADSPGEVHEDPIFKQAQEAINKALGK